MCLSSLARTKNFGEGIFLPRTGRRSMEIIENFGEILGKIGKCIVIPPGTENAAGAFASTYLHIKLASTCRGGNGNSNKIPLKTR